MPYSAIARQVGIHRVTVKQWLQQDLPPLEVEDPMTLAQTVEPEPPPGRVGTRCDKFAKPYKNIASYWCADPKT